MLNPSPVPLWEIMRLINSWNLLYAANVFGMISVPVVRGRVLGPQERERFASMAEAISKECLALGLRASWASAQRIVSLASKDGATAGEFADLCGEEFFRRLADEMSMTPVFGIAPDRVSFFSTPNLFGAEVATAFPSAILDVEEAGKCLALDRGTACVFHCMRVMEYGLRALAAALGIPYAPSWESYLTQINKQFARDWKDKEPEWKQKEAFYTEVAADLTTVKNAWRNPVMHVRGTYDPERAADVFNAVKAFMRHLARELKEAA